MKEVRPSNTVSANTTVPQRSAPWRMPLDTVFGATFIHVNDSELMQASVTCGHFACTYLSLERVFVQTKDLANTVFMGILFNKA